jgi:hypothetical protein
MTYRVINPFLMCTNLPTHFFPKPNLKKFSSVLVKGETHNTAPFVTLYKNKNELFSDLVHISTEKYLNSQVSGLLVYNYFRDVSTGKDRMIALQTWYRFNPNIGRLDVMNMCERTDYTDNYSSVNTTPDFNQPYSLRRTAINPSSWRL